MIIFLLVGVFYFVVDVMGVVKFMVNLGFIFLLLKMLFFGLFIIGCILSFVMGILMGIVFVLILIVVGIVNEIGISLLFICGVVVGGVMFGDNLFFIFDIIIVVIRI